MGLAAKAHGRMYATDELRTTKDVDLAARGARLNELFQSDVWKLDLLPLMQQLYDDYLEQVKQHQMDPDSLKPLDDLVVKLGGAFQVGLGAMERIAKRRIESAESMDRRNGQAPNF